MSDILVQLNKVNLSVRREPISMVRRLAGLLERKRHGVQNQQLLKEVDLKISAGERIGLVGHNGAGKSTLLRVLAGIYPITEGQIAINCNPYGLFSVGQGTNPKASGIDNIYLRCFQMGLSHDEIARLLPPIVRFSELGANIHRPVEQFSAGMQLRLNTAISLSMDADVLLLDEWIGAGDADFRAKIEKRLQVMLKQSRGLVIASHNHMLLQRLCGRVLWLEHGRVIADDVPQVVFAQMQERKVSTA